MAWSCCKVIEILIWSAKG